MRRSSAPILPRDRKQVNRPGSRAEPPSGPPAGAARPGRGSHSSHSECRSRPARAPPAEAGSHVASNELPAALLLPASPLAPADAWLRAGPGNWVAGDLVPAAPLPASSQPVPGDAWLRVARLMTVAG
jgi:hypothetical protein